MSKVPRPLAGKRVVELAQFIAGPTATLLLADFGAEVVKVEAKHGDGSRALPGTRFGSAYARWFNASKSSVVLDLREQADRKELDDLLARADALVCNLAPSALAHVGLDATSIRSRFPDLVATLISGYGQQDDRACMDTIAQCESGFAWLNGDAADSPRISAGWPTDYFSGLYAALATAMALADASRDTGVVIDISMLEVACAAMLGPAALMVSEGGKLAEPTGSRDRASAPSNVYACRDGSVYIYGGLDPYWRKLAPLVGGPASVTHDERLRHPAEFDALVSAWTRARDKATVLDTMHALAIPAGAVRDPIEAVSIIRGYRPDAVVRGLASGEHVPCFPGLFDSERPLRTPAPALGGARRSDP